MEEIKYCPMSFNNGGYIECQGSECAWFNKTNSCCALLVLSNSSINLAEMACGQRIIYMKEL